MIYTTLVTTLPPGFGLNKNPLGEIAVGLFRTEVSEQNRECRIYSVPYGARCPACIPKESSVGCIHTRVPYEKASDRLDF